MTSDVLQYIDIQYIHPGKYQPRRTFNPVALDELAQSIMKQGIIEPITVRIVEDAYFEIVAGERRWRAARIAGVKYVPCILKHLSEKDTALIALIENTKREDLSPLDEAEYLAEKFANTIFSKAEIGRAIGKSREWVSNLLRLNECPAQIKTLIRNKQIEPTHGRALLKLPEEKQVEFAQTVISKKMSVQALERMVKNYKQGNKTKPPATKDINLQALEDEVSTLLNTPVKFDMKDGKAGCITIEFYSKEQMLELLRNLSNA